MFPEAEMWSLTSSGTTTNEATAFAWTVVIMTAATVRGHFVDIQTFRLLTDADTLRTTGVKRIERP
jgi:hypothetical protein